MICSISANTYTIILLTLSVYRGLALQCLSLLTSTEPGRARARARACYFYTKVTTENHTFHIIFQLHGKKNQVHPLSIARIQLKHEVHDIIEKKLQFHCSCMSCFFISLVASDRKVDVYSNSTPSRAAQRSPQMFM